MDERRSLKTLHERIVASRENTGMSKGEAADALGVKYTRYVNWENGTSLPSADFIYKICRLFNVSADQLLQTYQDFTLGLDEAKIIDVYRSLQPRSKKLLRNIVRDFSDFRKDSNDEYREPALIPRPIYDLPASAGPGTFLDSSTYSMVEFPESVVPSEATFGVRVSGDSMEPDYPDGSIVFVKQMKNLYPGDVGIFTLNGDGFIKELGTKNNLISHNQDYKDIHIGEYDDLRVVGKVIGDPYVEE